MLTTRQEILWRKKAIQVERRLLNYYRDKSNGEPDGSFVMSAFKDGYYLGRKKQREQMKEERWQPAPCN